MAQTNGALRLPLRLPQVAHGGKHDVGEPAALEQVQQRRHEGGAEQQEREGLEEDHQPSRALPSAARRSACPNGVAVDTWW